MNRYFTQVWNAPKVDTLNIWIKKGVWMRGRSGDGIKTEVYLSGRRIKTRSIKMVKPVSRSDQDIKDQVLRVYDDTMTVFPKSEAGKDRLVVKAGNALFRQIDFVS